MKEKNATKKIILLLYLLPALCGVVFMSSCGGYKNDGKEVSWNTWNEGNGHSAYALDADPKSFEILNDDYARDNKTVFYEGNAIKGADSKSFRVVDDYYAKDKRHVYFCGGRTDCNNPATFKVKSYELSEDKNDFYWLGKAIHVDDKATFKLLAVEGDTYTSWAKDKNNAYLLGYKPIVKIHGIDYATFHVIKGEDNISVRSYACDKKHVYYDSHIVPGADPASFKLVETHVGQDKYRVYSEDKPTKVRNYEELEQRGNMYADKRNVYDDDFNILPHADAATFKNIEGNWYKDKSHVWWANSMLHNADVKTFTPVDKYSYYGGKLEHLGPDPNYGKDKRHVFFGDSIIADADPASFEIVSFQDGDGWTLFDKNKIHSGINSPQYRQYLCSKTEEKLISTNDDHKDFHCIIEYYLYLLYMALIHWL